MTSEPSQPKQPAKQLPLWLLFDGDNHCHRDFHAAGDKAAALFGRRVELLIERSKATRVAVAFDSRQSWRRELVPSYKSDRPEQPEGVTETIAAVREWCIENAVDVVEQSGFEADDLLATLTIVGRQRDARIVICSTDKDIRQLLDVGHVDQVLSCKRSGNVVDLEWMTATRVKQVYGVEPWQWVDYQTIVGDSVDCIKGADGIGEKVATKLLQTCHTLDAYYLNPWRVNLTQRQHNLLAKFRDEYKTVRRLVTLRRDVPIAAAWLETAEG